MSNALADNGSGIHLSAISAAERGWKHRLSNSASCGSPQNN
jgi:hypothetical protein